MSTALEFSRAEYMAPVSNLVPFPLVKGSYGKRTNSNNNLKSNGKPKATKSEPIRNPEDIKKLMNYFKETSFRNYMVFVMGISFALRASDLLKLTIGDVVNMSTGKVKPYFYVGENKTGKTNKIYINQQCREIIEIYLLELGEYYEKDPLFPSRKRDKFGNMKPIGIRTFNDILKEAVEAAGVSQHVSSHSMRKTFGYHLMKMHNNDQQTLYALQYMYNHTDLRTTYIYTGIEDDLTQNLREEITALFD